MYDFDLLDQLVNSHNGVLTTADALDENISKTVLVKYIQEKQLERVAHGIYLSPNAWRDEAHLLNLRCPQTVFSHDSALFYHDLTDREPLRLTVTVKTGYNPTHLTEYGVKVYTVKPELYPLGITNAQTSFGNVIRMYDMERTICDIVRSRSSMETQVYQNALKQYAKRKEKNLHRLMEYASIFHVEKLLRDYMGILL